MNRNKTLSKPADSEQESGKGLDGTACSLFLLPISQEPRPGQRVIVHLKTGETRECTATLMHTDQGSYTQYFHRRRAIDINQIAGWTNAASKPQCVVCGARVRNMNPKTTTCDPACTLARDHGITRQRALRLIGDDPCFNAENAIGHAPGAHGKANE